MRTLAKSTDLTAIVQRLRSLRVDDSPRWGVMQVPEMICHVRGSVRMAMGEIAVEPMRPRIGCVLFKVAALYAPVAWPKNFQTVPALTRGSPAMKLGRFETDVAETVADLLRFCKRDQMRVTHPFMGAMSFEDWMRYGYLHTDHHLRQFGR